MEYLKSLECLCVKGCNGSLSGDAGVIKAKLSGSIGIRSYMEPIPSGMLHTPYQRCTKFAALANVDDLSPISSPNTRYRVFVDTRDFHFAPQVNDTFIVESGGTSYKYNISAVTLS